MARPHIGDPLLVRFPAAVKAQLVTASAARGVSMSELVREAVAAYLGQSLTDDGR